MTDIKEYEPLWGAWYIDEKLGEGSYGKVYKVHKEEFGRIYTAAVKIISIPQNESDIIQAKSEGLNEESARSYFQAFVTDIIQEVDLMNAFRGNTNIVSLEDHKVIEKQGEIGWDIIIRMELLETLSSHITKKPMTQSEIIKLGIHICQALELCAKHNTIHRDIKPDNIFVSQYGDYKLGDFGIARQIERTMSGLSMKGTHQYMAPEVFKGNEYGSSVDTYSLGIVMYRFLNKNRAPFLPEYPNPITPRDRDEALQRRMSGEALPKIQGINEELNSIVLKACAYERNERFQSASEMKAALERLSQNDDEFSLPIIEISLNENENTGDYDDGVTLEFTSWDSEEKTGERTQVIFSRQEDLNSLENLEPTETIIKVPENIMNKLAIFSSIFWLMLSGLTFFSGNLVDVLIFFPLYALSLIQCYLKFENKIINYFFLVYITFYLLFSVLINFKIFDYSFLIFALSLLSLMASQNKKTQVISCFFMIICSVIFGILVFNLDKNTHYIYVAGTVAIPFLIFLCSPMAFLFGKSGAISRKNNFGAALLIALYFFTLIIFLIYITGLTKNSQLLYYIIDANFPGFSLERLSWWSYGRFVGTIIQFLAFSSLSLLAMAAIAPEQFLNILDKDNRKKIIVMIIFIILIIFSVIKFI